MDDATIIDLDEGWGLIENHGFKPLALILDSGGDYRARHGGHGPEEWSRIYTTVYKMCIQRAPHMYAEDLYQRIETTLSAYLRSSTLPALHGSPGEFMLRELARRWENHKLMVKWVTRTFSYVDRYYVKRHERPTLEHVGYLCFKRDVFDPISGDVRLAALYIVRRERDNESVDRALLKTILGIFAEMGMGKLDVYTDGWEKYFLEDTADFYRRASARWAEEDSFPDYMRKVDACINEERERAEQYLHHQTKDRLQRVCERELLTEHQQRMLEKENSGLVALLENNKQDDLRLLFKLYSRIQTGLGPIGLILKNHIKKEGMELVREQRARLEMAKAAEAADRTEKMSSHAIPLENNTNLESPQPFASVNPSVYGLGANAVPPVPMMHGSPSGAANHLTNRPDYIQSLLALHDRYMDLVNNCFEKHAVFTKSMKEAFERFVNEQVGDSCTAQLFANFCDSLLNISGVGAKMSEPEIEMQLEKLVKLFTYLSEKDVFQEFCRKQLAKRLLLDRSHSDDAERFLIGKLKQSCGSHFTSKLEGMITDMNVSRDTQVAFQKWNQERVQGSTNNQDSVSAVPLGVPGSSIFHAVDTSASAAGAAAAHLSGLGLSGVADGCSGGSCIVEGVEFSVRVLTTGHWPTYLEDKVTLPPEIEACTALFKTFYNSRTSQRVLRWVHSLGKATMETRLFVGKKPYDKIELHVSTHQMCILRLFNCADSLSYNEIWESLRCKTSESSSEVQSSEDLVKTSIMSLSTKKYPLLLKESKGREIKDSDIFHLNEKFVSPRKRLSIPMPTAKISEEEREAAHETVVEDRRHAIEAAIVRVMKQHKTLDHQVLIMEVSKLCNPVFKPEPRAIKNRIEELINREYLQREEGSSSSYKYLA